MLRRLAFLALAVTVTLLGSIGTGQAQRPEFARDTVTIETQRGGVFEFDVELALTRGEQAFGLMFVEEMPQSQGMLFVFESEAPRSFWMRNTLIPLDMIFIRADGTIANIIARAEPQTETSRPSDGPVLGVLEINGGLSALLGIGPGDRVVHAAFGE